MQTIAFLQRVLPQAPAYFAQFLSFDENGKTEQNTGKSHKANSLEALDKIIASGVKQGYDVYVSMAGYTSEAKGHYAKFIFSHKVHYLDIDCGPGKPYPDFKAALAAVNAFLKLTCLPIPLIIISGTGLHLYWPYSVDLPTAQWKPIAWMFRIVCNHAGLAIDGKVGIDPARLLRPPGTVNRKNRAMPVSVRPVFAAQDAYALLDVLTVVRPLRAYIDQHTLTFSMPTEKPAAPVDDSDLGAGMPGLDPYSAHQIGQAGCLAVLWFEHSGGDAIPPKLPIKMHQADWFSMARLGKFSVEGEAWFHQHSAKYRGYSRAESQKVLDRNEKRGVTCESLIGDAATRKFICDRCQHHGKINTPLHLGIAKVIPIRPVTPEQAADPIFQSNPQLVIPDALPGYENRPSGVFKKRMVDDKPAPSMFVVNHWIKGVTKIAINASSHQYVLHWLSPHGRAHDIVVSGGELAAHTNAVLKKLGDADIVFSSNAVNRQEVVVGYIRDWVHSIEKTNALPAAEQFGWQEDDTIFVLGTDSYTAGRHTDARLIDTVVTEARMYETRGTLDGQIRALRTFFPNHPDFLHAHFLILMGMAAVFLKFDVVPSPVTSAHSTESGHGKSLACRGALGVWGNPLLLEMKGTGASETAVNNRLSLAGSLPVVLDEMTGADAKKIASIITLVQGNKANDRANPNGTNRASRKWQTVAIVSTNDALRGLLERADTVKDGMHMRLIEFEYSNPTVKALGSQTNTKALLENYGHVGRELLMRFTADEPAMEVMYNDNLTRLRRVPGLSAQNDGGERVWQRALAAVMSLAIVTVQWGLLDLDIRAMHKFCIELLQRLRAELREVSPDPLTRLNQIIATLSSKAVFVDTAKPSTPGGNVYLVGDDKRVPPEVWMRQERDTGMTYINSVEFNRHAGAHAREVLVFAAEHGLCEPKMRRGIRLKAYLGVPDGRVNCYVFDQKALDALSHEAETDSAVVDSYEGIYDPPQRTVTHLRPVK